MGFHQCAVFVTAIGAAPVAVMDNLFASGQFTGSIPESLTDQMAVNVAGKGPADDFASEQIHHRGEVMPPPIRRRLGPRSGTTG